MPVLLRSIIVRGLLDLMACDVRQTTKTLVVCGSERKPRLFHYTALTDWFL
jgi:hypothetical protein